jgi:hypothetical protein
MSIVVVNLRYGSEISEVRCQRMNPDPLVEGNLLLEGVASLELRLMNGDRMLPRIMSVPKASVSGYYSGELVTVETLVAETEEFLKELSKKKSSKDDEAPSVQEWRGIEGTTYSA